MDVMYSEAGKLSSAMSVVASGKIFRITQSGKKYQDDLLCIRVAKNLRNANLNLALKIEIFWGFNLKKPQITDLEKSQRMNPQPQKGWPHPRLKFQGFLRIALKPKFRGSSKNLEF